MMLSPCSPSLIQEIGRIIRRGDNSNNDEDFISKLPDNILVSILARIPTPTAVSTSILSKRWRYLYKSMPIYQLCCANLVPRYPFRHHHDYDFEFEFITYRLQKFLTLLSGSNAPRTFNLACCFIFPKHELFRRCIHHLRNSGVETLILSFSCCSCEGRSMPNLYTHRLLPELTSLIHLRLSRCALPPYPKMKYCNNLKTLELVSAELDYKFVESILTICVSLESLSIHDCECYPRIRIRGHNLRLKTLVIHNSETAKVIKVFASNLYKFEYRGYALPNLVYEYVPQLEIMYMCIKSGDHPEPVRVMPYFFGEVAKFVPDLKFLTLVTKGGDFKQEGMQMGRFDNLRVLDITISWTQGSSNLMGLIPYLERCPALEELQLNLRDSEVFASSGTPQMQAVELSNLKKVEISGFRGSDNEIEFAKCILRNAVSLHEMCLIKCPKFSTGHGQWRSRSTSTWSKRTLKYMKKCLGGQALSPRATLVFRHRS